jgi:uncharacterized 2Fe-2S/4Fe-4S cluster protein (DUF4445 family)
MGYKGLFDCADRQVEVDLSDGCLITEAADAAGVVLNTSCGGGGTCGGCAVDLVEGTFRHDTETIEIKAGQPSRRVPGCRTRILSATWRVRVPNRSLVRAGEQIVVDFDLSARFAHDPSVRKVAMQLPPATLEDSIGDFERITRHLRTLNGFAGARVRPALSVLRALPDVMVEGGFRVTTTLAQEDDTWELIRVEPGDTSGRLYGVAVDLGTTTVVCSLVDLNAGQVIDTTSCYNQQTQRGEDVASRIVFSQRAEQLEELQRLAVAESINKLVRLLCNRHEVAVGEIARMVISGNTVMAHLLLAISPKNIGVSPFQPSTKFPGTFRASQIGLAMNPSGLVDIVPAIAGYVGGDIVSGIHVCGVHKEERTDLLIDIGTNGEIALGTPKGMWVCATAAGPAYEGSGISCGMRAHSGAIERIWIDGPEMNVRYKTINNSGRRGRPCGVCGSGLIDFLAEAFRVGLIERTGRFNRDVVRRCGRFRQVEFRGHPVTAFALAPKDETDDGIDDVFITEKDIERLLQAKAAIYVGARLLAKSAGLTLEAIDRIWLAGGFARHIDVRNAITIGMLPDLPLERFDAVGNASLAGAFAALVDRSTWGEFERIAGLPRVVELNKDPQFEDEYTYAMFLPNLMADRFPSVATS